MKDKDGNELKAGDICFYTERPHSNYADSIVEIYENNGELYVGTHIVNNSLIGVYAFSDPRGNWNIELDCYGLDNACNQTGVAKELRLLPDLELDDISLEMANKRFPLKL